MDEIKRLKFRRVLSLCGAFLVIQPTGVMFYWGNLSIYTSSYFLLRGVSISVTQSPWVPSLFFAAMAVFISMGGYMATFIGRRKTLLCGIVLMDASTAMCFYAVDVSYGVFVLLFGFTVGLGAGIVFGLVLEYCVQCTESSIGAILASVMQAGGNIGGSIYNELITWYINPYNRTPDIQLIGNSKFFSQVDVIERVPWTYLYLGIGSAALQLTGFCLLYDDLERNVFNSTQLIAEERIPIQHHERNPPTRETSQAFSHTPISKHSSLKQSLLKVMTSRAFYVLWFTAGLCETTVIFTNSYYKQIGQGTIADDHFLTVLGSSTVVANTVMRLSSGVAVKYLGVKNTFVGLFFSNAVLGSFFPVSPLIDKWLYYAITVLYLSFSVCIYTCFTPAAVVFLGQENFSLNFGLVWSASLAVNMMSPLLFQSIMTIVSWNALFQFIALLNFVAAFATMVFL